ncbi:hypothetical protein [Nocardioides sp. Leaf307]|nr:hypothetical protein [Nocardioides sp. Leaf307]
MARVVKGSAWARNQAKRAERRRPHLDKYAALRTQDNQRPDQKERPNEHR